MGSSKRVAIDMKSWSSDMVTEFVEAHIQLSHIISEMSTSGSESGSKKENPFWRRRKVKSADTIASISHRNALLKAQLEQLTVAHLDDRNTWIQQRGELENQAAKSKTDASRLVKAVDGITLDHENLILVGIARFLEAMLSDGAGRSSHVGPSTRGSRKGSEVVISRDREELAGCTAIRQIQHVYDLIAAGAKEHQYPKKSKSAYARIVDEHKDAHRVLQEAPKMLDRVNTGQGNEAAHPTCPIKLLEAALRLERAYPAIITNDELMKARPHRTIAVRCLMIAMGQETLLKSWRSLMKDQDIAEIPACQLRRHTSLLPDDA